MSTSCISGRHGGETGSAGASQLQGLGFGSERRLRAGRLSSDSELPLDVSKFVGADYTFK